MSHTVTKMNSNSQRYNSKHPAEHHTAGDRAVRQKRAMESVLPAHRTNRRKVVNTAQVPGGIFNGDPSGISLTSSDNAAKTTEITTAESIAEGSIDPSDVSISPNARLASFFAYKGDAPLSEMEMEGVLSVMKQTQGCETVDTAYSTAYETKENDLLANPGDSSVLTNRRGTSLGNTPSNSMRLPPQSLPHHESGTSGANHSVSFAAPAGNTPVENIDSDELKKQMQPLGRFDAATLLLKLMEKCAKIDNPGKYASLMTNTPVQNVDPDKSKKQAPPLGRYDGATLLLKLMEKCMRIDKSGKYASLMTNTPVQNVDPDKSKKQTQPQSSFHIADVQLKWTNESDKSDKTGESVS